MLTAKAKAFTEHNKQYAIYAAKWLPENRPPSEWQRLKFRFINGSVRTLQKIDLQSLEIQPRWKK